MSSLGRAKRLFPPAEVPSPTYPSERFDRDASVTFQLSHNFTASIIARADHKCEVIMTFDEVIAPMTREAFLRNYVSRNYLVIKGCPGRFHGLVEWSALDDALSRVRVNDERVMLVKNGQKIAADAYVQSSLNGKTQYLIGPAVNRQISEGATLVVNAVDELIGPVRTLSESCEEIFEIYVAANLYAGWCSDKGFEVHWDGHDTLIVQVRGRKNWKVWRPTREHPVQGDGRHNTPPPPERPAWEGSLEDGDILYMPRGWWHVACPLNEPSVHITFGIAHKTGLDLLHWLVDATRESIATRMGVPHWCSEADQANWLVAVRMALEEQFTADALDRYMRSVRERAHTRPIVRLPESTAPVGAETLDDTTQVRLTRGARLEFVSVATFMAKDVTWHCHVGIAPALRVLSHTTPHTMNELKGLVDVRYRTMLRPFLRALLTAGVVWTEAPGRQVGAGTISAAVSR